MKNMIRLNKDLKPMILIGVKHLMIYVICKNDMSFKIIVDREDVILYDSGEDRIHIKFNIIDDVWKQCSYQSQEQPSDYDTLSSLEDLGFVVYNNAKYSLGINCIEQSDRLIAIEECDSSDGMGTVKLYYELSKGHVRPIVCVYDDVLTYDDKQYMLRTTTYGGLTFCKVVDSRVENCSVFDVANELGVRYLPNSVFFTISARDCATAVERMRNNVFNANFYIN